MDEKNPLEKLLEQLEGKASKHQLALFIADLMNDPQRHEVLQCRKTGKYVITHHEQDYCGLSLLHQRPMRCSFTYEDSYISVPAYHDHYVTAIKCMRCSHMVNQEFKEGTA